MNRENYFIRCLITQVATVALNDYFRKKEKITSSHLAPVFKSAVKGVLTNPQVNPLMPFIYHQHEDSALSHVVDSRSPSLHAQWWGLHGDGRHAGLNCGCEIQSRNWWTLVSCEVFPAATLSPPYFYPQRSAGGFWGPLSLSTDARGCAARGKTGGYAVTVTELQGVKENVRKILNNSSCEKCVFAILL